MVFEDYVLGSCIIGDVSSLELLASKHVIGSDLAHRGLHLACCNGNLHAAQWLCGKFGISPTEHTFLRSCVHGNPEVARWICDTYGFFPRKIHISLMCRELIRRAAEIQTFAESPEKYEIPQKHRDLVSWMSSFETASDVSGASQEMYRIQDPGKKKLACKIAESVASIMKKTVVAMD